MMNWLSKYVISTASHSWLEGLPKNVSELLEKDTGCWGRDEIQFLTCLNHRFSAPIVSISKPHKNKFMFLDDPRSTTPRDHINSFI